MISQIYTTYQFCKLTTINIKNKEIEQVKAFKYLGSIINTDNTMEEEIKAIIASGNKVYFANKKMFQSRPISKTANLKLYYSVIRPINSVRK